ncbi:MAG: hypothetical protein K2Q18_03965, partial [Bdellovibrionales bacterium]|nr:hypothetical protein [Bdellovibrionales bacterium]
MHSKLYSCLLIILTTVISTVIQASEVVDCPDRYPNGNALKFSDGSMRYENGNGLRFSDGSMRYPNGNGLRFSDGSMRYENGNGLRFSDGSMRYENGNGLRFSNGSMREQNGNASTTKSISFLAPFGNSSMRISVTPKSDTYSTELPFGENGRLLLTFDGLGNVSCFVQNDTVLQFKIDGMYGSAEVELKNGSDAKKIKEEIQ